MDSEPEMQGFEIDPRLRADCFEMGRFALCRLLLMNERRFPWFILVPQRAGVTEIFQLAEADQLQLMRESSLLAQAIADEFLADKLNIAAIGNLVPQLHVHHVVRYQNDEAWPAPVWGRFPREGYAPEDLDRVKSRIWAMLAGAATVGWQAIAE